MTTNAPAIDRFPGYGPDAELDLSGIADHDLAALAERFADGTIGALSEAITRVGGCAHPIRLHGSSTTIDTATGEVVSTFSSDSAPLGVVHVPCGNRRASVCPACSRVYARDTFEVIRSGVTGGKTVPEQVADNPLLFVTLTAPSFGRVHRENTTARMCPRHGPAAETAPGSPTCPACYDYTTHVIWQWWAPELWRRFTIRITRLLAAHLGVAPSALGKRASIQFAKVAEYQTRGAIHFHALIRLDGPRTSTGFEPAPVAINGEDFAALVARAVPQVEYTAPPAFEGDPGRLLRFGAQHDVRLVRAGRRSDDPDAPLLPEQVAGYVAKYVTKSLADDDHTNGPRRHYGRLRAEAEHLADLARQRATTLRRELPQLDPADEADPYERLVKWVNALGFRGHIATKSRRYSITLGALRRARRRFQALAEQSRRTGHPIDTADLERRLLAEEFEDETTLVVGTWTYSGQGWHTRAETGLALATAARAREYASWRADQRNQPTNEGNGS